MKRILIIQPLALGDLLLISPLCSGLREARPETELWLLGNQAFAPLVSGNPAVGRFLGLPYAQLYQEANSPEPKALSRGLAKLAGFAHELGTDFDLLYNPAYNDLAAALARICPPAPVLGSDFSPEGFLISRGDWPNLHHLFMAEAAFNPFHTADLHCLALGVQPSKPGLVLPLKKRHHQEAAELLAGLGAQAKDQLVALHLGATREDKCWPLQSFVELGRLLSGQGLKPVFTGNQAEAKLTAGARAALPGALDAAGKTSIPGLAALLARCRLLISNDSGPIHLAAAVGTPVVSISLGKVQFRATGPYLDGGLALEADLDCAPCADPGACPHQGCKQAITPQHALAAAGLALGGPAPARRPGARLYRAFRADDGLLDWAPLWGGAEQPVYRAYRKAWLAALRPGNGAPLPPERQGSPCRRRPWAELDKLAGRAHRGLSAMASGPGGGLDQAALPAGLQQVNQAFAGIKALGLAEPLLKPLAIYLLHRLAGLDLAEPLAQIRAQIGLYSQIRAVARLTEGCLN